jgi:hypothetical protein
MKLKDVINNIEGMDFTDFTIRTIEGWSEEDVSTHILI